VVVAATVAFGLLGTLWSLLAPLGEAPDEPAHLALVLHLADGNPYPDYDGLQNQAAIIRLCRTHAAATRACPRPGEVVTATSVRRHPASEAPDRSMRPAWNDDGGARQVGQVNQMPQHPPLYYQAMAAVLRLERAVASDPWSLDRELALLRVVNALVLAPLPLLAWWAARRFGSDRATAIAAALAVLAIPMLSHIGATLNNDNLLTLLGAVLVALLAGVARGDRSTRTAVALGVVTGLALLTKAFAVVFPPAILVAYLVGSRGADGPAPAWADRLRLVLRPVVVAGAATAAVAMWWYVRARVRTGSFTPSVEDRRLTAELAPPGFSPEVTAFAAEFAESLTIRFWGAFGWYTVRVPLWWAVVATGLLMAALALALVPRRGPDASTRAQRLSLLTPVVLLGVFVAARAWDLYATTSRFQFIQGRYLFAGIVGVLVLAAMGVVRVVHRWAPVAVAGLALLLQADAARRALSGGWGGPGVGVGAQLEAMVAWGAWPGELVAVVAVAAVAVGLWLVVELTLETRRIGGSGVPEAQVGGPVGSTAT
jgi:small subunit ribosomal protein S36